MKCNCGFSFNFPMASSNLTIDINGIKNSISAWPEAFMAVANADKFV